MSKVSDVVEAVKSMFNVQADLIYMTNALDACHSAAGEKLDFDKMIEMSKNTTPVGKFSFISDVVSIIQHVDKETGELKDYDPKCGFCKN